MKMKRAFCLVMLGLIVTVSQCTLLAQDVPPTCLATVPDYAWEERFEEKKAQIAGGNVDLLFVGDSITHNWDDFGAEIRDYYYGDRKMVNMGFGGDKTQHILWRLENSHLEKISPKVAVVMGGINNLMRVENPLETPKNTALGMKAVVDKIESFYPDIKILVLYTFPAADHPDHMFRARVAESNAYLLDLLRDDPQVTLKDINYLWLNANSMIPIDIMPDSLHPNAYGYWLWAQTVEPEVAEMLGVPAKLVPALPEER